MVLFHVIPQHSAATSEICFVLAQHLLKSYGPHSIHQPSVLARLANTFMSSRVFPCGAFFQQTGVKSLINCCCVDALTRLQRPEFLNRSHGVRGGVLRNVWNISTFPIICTENPDYENELDIKSELLLLSFESRFSHSFPFECFSWCFSIFECWRFPASFNLPPSQKLLFFVLNIGSNLLVEYFKAFNPDWWQTCSLFGHKFSIFPAFSDRFLWFSVFQLRVSQLRVTPTMVADLRPAINKV